MHLRGRIVRHAALSLVLAAAVTAVPLVAQQASQGDGQGGTVITVNGKPADGNRSYSITKPGTFDEAHFKDADLRGVLRLLSVEGRRNIVASKDVSGRVTADFYNVTFDEALDAIMRATGYVYEKRGNFYFVYTPAEMEEVKRSEETVTRIFRLGYVRAADIEPIVKPLLTEQGKVTMNPASEVGISTSDTEAGGDNYSGSEVLIIRDLASAVDKVAEIIEQLDVKPIQLLIEATMLRATLTEDNALGIDISQTGDWTIPNLDTSIDFNTSTTSGVPNGGLSMTVSTGRADFLIRALETVTDVAVMANPKLMVLNKQRGEVLIGSRDGYLTTTVTETSAVQSVQFLETGTRLVVRPFVGRDGYIRMEVHPEDSSGSVDTVGSSVLPSETTTEVTSNVIVKDGHTIVIGGLFRERTTVGRSQVPVAGNVPILGSLFRRTSDATEREEVIILITPHILEDQVASEMGQNMKSEIARQRIGLREGMHWWGRSRLAQTHMNWARKYADNGNTTLAAWNADLALSLEPRMADAIHLKEKLTGQAIWSDHNKSSEVQHFLEKMMMREIGRDVDMLVPPNRPKDLEQLDPEVKQKFGISGIPEISGVQPPQPRETTPQAVPVEEPEQQLPTEVTEDSEPWNGQDDQFGRTEQPLPQPEEFDPEQAPALQAQADPIRGDLPIEPAGEGEWFDQLVEDWDRNPQPMAAGETDEQAQASDIPSNGPIEPFVTRQLWRGIEDLLPETAPVKWWQELLTQPQTPEQPVVTQAPPADLPKVDQGLTLEIEPIDESELDLVEPVDELEWDFSSEDQE